MEARRRMNLRAPQCVWEKKERSSSARRWILIKYWWSAVLKAWLGPDWAKHTHTHTDTHRHTHTNKWHTHTPESEQVFIMPPAGQPATFRSSLFHSHLSASALHFLLPHGALTHTHTHIHTHTHTHKQHMQLKVKRTFILAAAQHFCVR